MILKSKLNATALAATRRFYSASSIPPAQPFRTHTAEGAPTTQTFYDKDTATWTYLLHCPKTQHAAIIDPVLNYDSSSGRITTSSADGLLSFIESSKLSVQHILETHAHADHLTSAKYLSRQLNAPVSIGKRIEEVQRTFAARYNLSLSSLEDSFDTLLDDDAAIRLGEHVGSVMHLPGHTPDHIGYVFGKHVFTGDSIFLDPVYTARADFPGGVAASLQSSIHKLMSLPPDYKLFVGHDYPGANREESCWTTVGDQLALNDHLKRDDFAAFRQNKDKTLSTPKLLHPAIQFNIRGGRLPPPDDDGLSRFRIPITSTVDVL
ncbi:hypothetical protein E3P99_02274 [Wallemia hederae]|uniref:Metallo-beta-lactamase domain-containing protein n=1 Tax=Wallemia hederae TaxID=1540922 RepID=A0A4V4LT62_9BASI|nr:hypothetical protein E3P99_02274 [Wallemia hederae]